MRIDKISNITPIFHGKEKAVSNVLKTTRAFPTAMQKPTAFDKYLFRGYTFALGLKLNAKPSDIKNLFKLEGEEFVFEAYEFLIRHLGIPIKLRPPIIINKVHENINMAYDYTMNKIEVNPEMVNEAKKDKVYVFAALRHEIQHLLQNLNIYRSEKVGAEAIEVYSEKVANGVISSLEEMVNNLTLEIAKEMEESDNIRLMIVESLKYMKNTGNIKEYNKSIKILKNMVKQEQIKELTRFRKRVISEMGIIKSGSREEKRAEKYFEDFKNSSYYNEDGTIHNGKYLYSITETEAFIAESMARAEAEGGIKGCYIKNNREEALRIGLNVSKIKNRKPLNISPEEILELKEVMEIKEQLEKKYKTEDEFIKNITKYLYD